MCSTLLFSLVLVVNSTKFQIMPSQGVVTYMSPVEVFATVIKIFNWHKEPRLLYRILSLQSCEAKFRMVSLDCCCSQTLATWDLVSVPDPTVAFMPYKVWERDDARLQDFISCSLLMTSQLMSCSQIIILTWEWGVPLNTVNVTVWAQPALVAEWSDLCLLCRSE